MKVERILKNTLIDQFNSGKAIVLIGPRQVGKALIEAKDNDRFVVTYKTKLPMQEGAYSIQFQLTERIVKDKTAKFLDVIDDAIVFRVSSKKEAIIWSKVFITNSMEVESL